MLVSPEHLYLSECWYSKSDQNFRSSPRFLSVWKSIPPGGKIFFRGFIDAGQSGTSVPFRMLVLQVGPKL